MGIKKGFKTVASAALISLLCPTADADTIIVKGSTGREIRHEGEIIAEDDDSITILTIHGVKLRISKDWVKKIKRDDPEKQAEQEEYDKKIEEIVSKADDSRNALQKGKNPKYFTSDEVLDGNNRYQWKLLPELNIEDLKRISNYPQLRIVQKQYYKVFNPGSKLKDAEIEKNKRTSPASDVILGRNFNMQLANFPHDRPCISIKHYTDEKIDGVEYPKDLVLIPINRLPRKTSDRGGFLERLVKKEKNKTYTETRKFPQPDKQIIGRINIKGEEYVVVDCYLFSREKYAEMPKGARPNFGDFSDGRIDLWREYLNLRGKTEKEVDEFHEKRGTLMKKRVKLGGKYFTYVHYPDEKDISKVVAELEKAEGKDDATYSDYTKSESKSPEFEKLLHGKKTLGQLIDTYDDFFIGKTVSRNVEGWQVPMEELMKLNRHDCDSGSKIVVNGCRQKGFPANLVFTYTNTNPRDLDSHVWVELYVPDLNVVVTYDVNTPERNYIFKADSKEKMDYVFDRKMRTHGSYVFQLTLNKAFDLE